LFKYSPDECNVTLQGGSFQRDFVESGKEIASFDLAYLGVFFLD